MASPGEDAFGVDAKHVHYSDDGTLLVTCGQLGHLAVWNAYNVSIPLVAIVADCESSLCNFLSAAISPDGSRIVTGDDEGKLTVWRTSDLSKVFEHLDDDAWGEIPFVTFLDASRIVVFYEYESEPHQCPQLPVHSVHSAPRPSLHCVCATGGCVHSGYTRWVRPT